MAYSVNWATKVVTIPKADTVLVTSTPDVRSLDVTTLWATLRSIEDDEIGINYATIVKNTSPLTVAGITLARVVEIINGYTITFEDGQWAVNIIGGNSNLADVVNKNQVSVNTANSAGVVQVGGGAGDPWAVALPGSYPAGQAGHFLGNRIPTSIDDAVVLAADAVAAAELANDNAVIAAANAAATQTQILDNQLVDGSLTMRQAMRIILASLTGKCSRVGNTYYFRDTNDTKDRIVAEVEGQHRVSVTIDGT